MEYITLADILDNTAKRVCFTAGKGMERRRKTKGKGQAKGKAFANRDGVSNKHGVQPVFPLVILLRKVSAYVQTVQPCKNETVNVSKHSSESSLTLSF